MPRRNTVLAGHGLRHEGWAFIAVGVRAYQGAGPGMALCECGDYSPQLPNRAARKRWHQDHKDAIRLTQTASTSTLER